MSHESNTAHAAAAVLHVTRFTGHRELPGVSDTVTDCARLTAQRSRSRDSAQGCDNVRSSGPVCAKSEHLVRLAAQRPPRAPAHVARAAEHAIHPGRHGAHTSFSPSPRREEGHDGEMTAQ